MSFVTCYFSQRCLDRANHSRLGFTRCFCFPNVCACPK